MRPIQTSYAPEDVTLLLQPVAVTHTDVAEKERLIQSGARHYSEMLSREALPAEDYLHIYRTALDANARRMAEDVGALARGIGEAVTGAVTLVSLVRAGLPLGVLLTRALRRAGRQAHHYGVSIIRDRGLDAQAMRTIMARHPADGLVFVDGWTGKGAIAGELARSWPGARLATLADMGGFAWMAPSAEDWLIPSGILGGVVSGLISRTVLTDEIVASGGYHGAAEQSHLAPHDLSRAFVDRIWAEMGSEPLRPCAPTPPAERAQRRAVVERTIAELARREAVHNLNRIKPGIAEATRAILRRRPHKVYLADDDGPDLAALRHLIARDGLVTEVAPALLGPYRAVTIIAQTS